MNIVDRTVAEFDKYAKYITFATVVAALVVGVVVVYGTIAKKG